MAVYTRINPTQDRAGFGGYGEKRGGHRERKKASLAGGLADKPGEQKNASFGALASQKGIWVVRKLPAPY